MGIVVIIGLIYMIFKTISSLLSKKVRAEIEFSGKDPSMFYGLLFLGLIAEIVALIWCFRGIPIQNINFKEETFRDSSYNYTTTGNEEKNITNTQTINQNSSNSITNTNQNTSDTTATKEVNPIKKPAGLNVACYTDESKTQWIWLGTRYVSENPSQTNISKIYCTWTNFDSPNGIAGYHVYIGKNSSAIPSRDGYFTKNSNTILTFKEPGRYRFMIQAKDNKGNISEVVDFGSYHYLMFEEDKRI